MAKYHLAFHEGLFLNSSSALYNKESYDIVPLFEEFSEYAKEVRAKAEKNTGLADIKTALACYQQVSRPLRSGLSVNKDSKVSVIAADIDKVSDFMDEEDAEEFYNYLQSDQLFADFPEVVLSERTRAGARVVFAIDYTMLDLDNYGYTPNLIVKTDVKHLHKTLVKDRLIPYLVERFAKFDTDSVDTAMESIDRAVIFWTHSFTINKNCKPYAYTTDKSLYADCNRTQRSTYVDVVSDNKNSGFLPEQLSWLEEKIEDIYDKVGKGLDEEVGLVNPYIEFGETYNPTSTGNIVAGASPRQKYIFALWSAARAGLPENLAYKIFMCVPGYTGVEHEESTAIDVKSSYKKVANMPELKRGIGTFMDFLKTLGITAPFTKADSFYQLKEPSVTERVIDVYLSEDSDYISSMALANEDRKFNIIQSPTGTGKTTLSFSLVKQLYSVSDKPPLCVIVEPYTNLVRAIGNKAKEEGLNVIMLSKDEDSPEFTKRFELNKYLALAKQKPTLVISTYDSFYYQFVKGGMPSDLVIIDELHTIVKESNFRKTVLPQLFAWASTAVQEEESFCKVLSLSATIPVELPIVLTTLDIPNQLYIYEAKSSIPTSIYMHAYINDRKNKLATAVGDILDSAKNQLKYVPPTIIHNNNKDENLLIELYLKQKGYDCESANSEKQDTIHQFQNGDFDILIATDVAVAGYDLKGDKFQGKESLIIEASSFRNEIFNPESIAQLAGRFRVASKIKIVRVCPDVVPFMNVLEDEEGPEADAYRDATKLYRGNDLEYTLSSLSKQLLISDIERVSDAEILVRQHEIFRDVYASEEYDPNEVQGISLYSGVNVSVINEEVKIQIPQVVNTCLNKRNRGIKGSEFFKILKKYISKLEVNLFSAPYDELVHPTELSPDFASFCKDILENTFSKVSSYKFLTVGLLYIDYISGLNPRHRETFSALKREIKGYIGSSVEFLHRIYIEEGDFSDGLDFENVVDNFVAHIRTVFIDYCNFVYNHIQSPNIPVVQTNKQYIKLRKDFDSAFMALSHLGFVKSHKDFIFAKPGSELSMVHFTEAFNTHGRELVKTFLSNNVVSPIQTVLSIDKDIIQKLDARFEFQIDNPSKLPMFIRILDKIRKRTDKAGEAVYTNDGGDNTWLSVYYRSFAFNLVHFIRTNTPKLAKIDKLLSWTDLSQSVYKTLRNAYRAISQKYFGTEIDCIKAGKDLELNINELSLYFDSKWSKYTNLRFIRKISDYIGKVVPRYTKDKEAEKVFTYEVLGIEDLGLDYVLSNIQYFKKFFTN